MSCQQDGSLDNGPGSQLWICRICNKEYKTELWFNRHLSAKHAVNGGGGAAASVVSDLTQRSGQEQHHTSPCAPLLHSVVDQGNSERILRKLPLKIPSLSRKEWDSHNHNLEALIAVKVGVVNVENAAQELEIFDETVYNYFEDVFGTCKETQKSSQDHAGNPLKVRLRKRKRELRKELKDAKRNSDSARCHNLARAYRSLLKLVQGLSDNMKKNHEDFLRSKNEAEFDRDKFGYSKRKLNPQAGKLTFSLEEAEAHFKQTYEDKARDIKYSAFRPEVLTSIASGKVTPPSRGDIDRILKKTRNKSAPGPNGIPYVVYKNCPSLQQHLLKFYNQFWKSQSCPASFGTAVIKLIPKEDNCNTPSKTRPIALTNTHGKVFLSIVADRVSKYMDDNKLFNSSLQKGFVSGVSGCLEHTSLLSEALADARKHERQIFVAWLDLGNAFGSVKHNLLQHAMAHYQVPQVLRYIIYHYYERLTFKLLTKDWESTEIKFETGIFQGCCFSPVGFKIVFNLLLDYIKEIPRNGCYTFRKDRNLVLPPCLAFADDLTLLCRTKKSMDELLQKVDEFCKWSRCLKIKTGKCRALCLARRNTIFGPIDAGLAINGEIISKIDNDAPFKFLGKFFQSMGKPDPNYAINKGFKMDIKVIDSLPLSGPRKSWIYNNVLIAKLSWPLLVYEVNKSTISSLEAEATAALKRWLGLRKCMDSSILYRSENNFGFGLKRISTVMKQFAVTRSSLLSSSEDMVVREATSTSRMNLASLQEQVIFRDRFMSGINRHREGLGWKQSKVVSEVNKMRALVLEEDEMDAVVHAQGLAMQHDWVVLGESCIPPKVMWKAFIYEWSPELLKFYANALQCTLPDPSNLRRWGLSEVDTCPLCSRGRSTALHVLAGCPVALREGRYTWRHDRVLGVLREAVSLAIAKSKRSKDDVAKVQFVKSGEKAPASRPVAVPSIVKRSGDWRILTDFGNLHYEFPPEVAVTSLCPDLTAVSTNLKTAIIMELTVPWDTNIPSQHEYKLNKYASLCSAVREKGYKCHFYAVEVGARGLPGKSVHTFLKDLGLGRTALNDFLKRISKAALEGSYRVWLRRAEAWSPGGESVGPVKALKSHTTVTSPGPGASERRS